MLDRRMLCLARSRDALDATVRILASADAKTVERAIDLVAGLGEVDACRAAAVLAADTPPAALRADVDEIERLVAGANANREAGRYPEAIRMAEDALTRARQIRYLPAIATASAAVVARDLLREGYGEREPQITLLDAVHAADRAHNDNLAATLWTDFLYMEGVWAGRRTEARRWIPFAEAAIDRAGGDPLLSASLDSAIAGILYWDGDYLKSLERYQRVVDVRHRLLGPMAPSTLYALHNLGLARENLGEYSEAVRLHLDALDGTQRVYGPDHPRVADSWQFVGRAQQKMKAWAAARDSLLHALRIREHALGPLHGRTMNIYTQIAEVLIDAGDYDDAIPYALHPFEVSRTHPGLVVWHAVEGLELLVKLERRRGDLRAARAYLKDAIDLDPGPAPESLGISRPLVDLAQIAYELDDVQSARSALGRALRLERPGTTEPLPADIWQRAHRLARQLGMDGVARGG
jgi:serine/threonine-protein kinase